MKYIFVIWLGDKAIEKVFTSLRIILWSNVLNKLLNKSKNSFLIMLDKENNSSFINLIEKLNLLNNEDIYFLEISSNIQQESIENHLKNSKLISYDHENRLMINIEYIDKDYLIKSSKDNTNFVRLTDENRLFDKLYSLKNIFEQSKDQENEINVIHLCDFQYQYQCELFGILSEIIHSNLKQYFLTLAPAVIGNDRPTIKYDELSVDNYIKEVLVNIVHERTSTSPFIPIGIFKLQLMCRKQNSIVHLRSNLETNHDILFLLYTGARLVSILNSYEEKYQYGLYPSRELFHDQLENMLMNKDEQEFLKWIDLFQSHFLVVLFNNSNKLQINLDKIFQEFILFCRRLSPYYSKVRILTENQEHLLSIMFARLELIERIVNLLRQTLKLIDIPLIERM